MSFIPKPHEIYKHFKGNLYQIVAIAEHTETKEKLVVYQALYGDFRTYARPLDMFVSRVDKEKYPEIIQEFRFELQGEDSRRQENETDLGQKPIEKQAAEPEQIQEPEDTLSKVLDPLVLEFLDADSYGEKLNILAALQHRVTDDMITTMAMACDVEVEEGETQERFEALKNCLLTLEKYECNRLR